MVTLDETTRARIAGLMDADGKIPVTDDMPEDLKYALNYLNNNDVNILNAEQGYVEDDEDETAEVDPSMDELGADSYDDSSYEVETHSEIKEDDENVSTNDLNDLF